DDLEAIVSLGFRGEALASVSSVSRLTFTSKPAEQDQAWQAISEGRDMQVKIEPVAHPQGTTVEVLDLFFNTPARRRFLKTEKTEFQHIDELIRRIALCRFEITFVLKHNGKVIRQYHTASTQAQQEKRLALICSENFAKGSIYFTHADGDLKISGWITDRLSSRGASDVQYCYINGRMIRDKLVLHAIKQAYAYILPEGKYAGFVLYIECDPAQVDVNVHPAKHEVRFHQARWVHDFIVSVLADQLNSSDLTQSGENETIPQYQHGYSAVSNDINTPVMPSSSAGNTGGVPSSSSGSSGRTRGTFLSSGLQENEVNAYCDFVSEAFSSDFSVDVKPSTEQADYEIVALFNARYLLLKLTPQQMLFESNTDIIVLSLNALNQQYQRVQLVNAWENGEVIAQSLLLPVRLTLATEQLTVIDQFSALFTRLGFVFKFQHDKLIVSKVPALLRGSGVAPLTQIIPELLNYLQDKNAITTDEQALLFCDFLVKSSFTKEINWQKKTGTALLEQVVREDPTLLKSTANSYFDADLSLLLKGL
ncbi:MAG TPA: DNA mismatch repair protein MutL, partial [Psychromonas hadalis]|nr:DNA mismatch repair protein MutL [Psychromonas hadalis]